MKFTDAIQTCYKKYFVGRQRASRSEFWWFYLYNMSGLVLFSAFIPNEQIFGIWIYVHLIPQINVGVRRIHDSGLHGFLIFVPLINLYFLAKKGDPFENKYGAPTAGIGSSLKN
jgi:uncharacterized membrane protein YhaH (DUF805 family)